MNNKFIVLRIAHMWKEKNGVQMLSIIIILLLLLYFLSISQTASNTQCTFEYMNRTIRKKANRSIIVITKLNNSYVVLFVQCLLFNGKSSSFPTAFINIKRSLYFFDRNVVALSYKMPIMNVVFCAFTLMNTYFNAGNCLNC